MVTGSLRRFVGPAVLLCTLVAALVVPRPAAAITETRRRGEAAFLEGVKAFKAGDLAAAAGHFEAAAAVDAHPVLFFNLAVVYDRLGDKPKAIRYYKDYLRSEPNDAPLGRFRLKQLDPKALEALDKEIEQARLLAAAGGKASRPGGDPGAPEVPEVGGGGGGGRIGALTWGVLGVGVAALGAGTVFGVMTQGAVDDFNSATLRSDAEDAQDRAESNALFANVGLGVGAAAVAAGAVLLVLDLTADPPASEDPAAAGSGGGWTLTPVLSPGAQGLVVGTRF